MTHLSAGRKIFFRLYEISERCCCRRLGKMINKSKRIRPLCYVFFTDGRQDHSYSSWSLDSRLDDGELGFDSLEDERHYFPPQCFVRGTYPTQSLLSAPWEFVPEGKVSEAVTLLRTATKCRAEASIVCICGPNFHLSWCLDSVLLS